MQDFRYLWLEVSQDWLVLLGLYMRTFKKG